MPREKRAIKVLLVFLFLSLLATPLLAQEGAIQPQLRLHLPEAPEDATPNVVALTERVNGDLLRRLNEENRFAISLGNPIEELGPFIENLDPPEGTDVLVAGVIDRRRDGSYRFLFDVWSGRLERVTYSQEFDARGLPVMGNEDAILLLSRELQQSIEEAVLDLFPGFGWLVFNNRGASGNYEVVIGDASAGVNLQEISLLPGEWEIEILQEIEGEVYIMARERINLVVNDYYQIVFELASEPPEIPGYLRLEQTIDDWKVGFEFGYDYLIPVTDSSEELFDSGFVVLSRLVFNDVPFRNLIFGVDTGVGFLDSYVSSGVDTDNYFLPLLGFLGYRFGPLGGVDFTIKAAGGAQLAVVEYVDSNNPDPNSEPVEYDEIVATVRGSAEFGFNWGRYVRFHGGASYWSFLEESGSFGFVSLHAGLGIKF